MLLWDRRRLTISTLQNYATIIKEKCGVSNIWGFVDGTIRPMCRPSTIDQREWYTSYKKIHGFKFQAISTPDGLISSLAGPTTAVDGDWAMWHESDIELFLREVFDGIEDDTEPLIFGDPAYKGAYGVTSAYVRQPRRPLTANEHEFNRTMLAVRITIEQLFGRTLNLWASNRHKYSQKIGHSPVAAHYLVAVLLTNIHTCIGNSDNQVSDYFNCKPPTLVEYLGSVSESDGDVLAENLN